MWILRDMVPCKMLVLSCNDLLATMDLFEFQDLHGRNIRVSYATERTGPRPFNGGGGGGDYRGGY